MVESEELLRELVDGLARIEARIGAIEGSATAPRDGTQRVAAEDEDLLADDEVEEQRRERLIKKFASTEVYGSLEQDSFHRHARDMVDMKDNGHNGQPSPKQLLRQGLLHPSRGFRLCAWPPFEL